MTMMNRINAILLLLLSSNYVLADSNKPNFDSRDGVLLMPVISVDNEAWYGNVKLQLDFITGQFSVIAATPIDNICAEDSSVEGCENTELPAEIIEEHEIGGLNVALQGCLIREQSITCHLLLTNNEFDRSIGFCGNRSSCSEGKSTLFDDRGNQYFPTKVSIGNKIAEGTSYLEQRLVADITTEATITFENISTRASEISLLELGFDVGLGEVSGSEHRVGFRNIQF